MNLNRNKIFIYLFILILFIAGTFYLKNTPLLQKYVRKLDFINYKKTVDYLGKKHSKTFSQQNYNVYGSLNLFKLMNKNLNKKEISFVIGNYQNCLFFLKDSDIQSILSLKIFNTQSQLKNAEYSMQILNYMNQYPWNKIAKLYDKNIKTHIHKYNESNFLCLSNDISFN